MTIIHSQRTIDNANKHSLAAYRGLLSSLAEMERDLVARGVIRPEERRIYSREERRAMVSSSQVAVSKD